MQDPEFIQPDVLVGFNDWLNLVYDGGGKLGALQAGDSEAVSTRVDEVTVQQLLADLSPALLEEDEAAPLDVVSYSPEEGLAPLVVSFDGSGSIAVTGSIVSWEWDFGDGATGLGATATHTYRLPGEYYCSLTVTDSNGRVNLVPLLNIVNVAGDPPTSTADFYSRKNGDWADPCTWNPAESNGGCGSRLPLPSSSVEIFHNVIISGVSSCETLKLSGSISGQSLLTVSGATDILGGSVNAALTVQGNTTVSGGGSLSKTLRTKNINVNGTFAGPGVIYVSGAGATNSVVFTNNGTVSVDGVEFGNAGEAFKYVTAGNGVWNIRQGIQLNASNTLEITGAPAMNSGYLANPAGGKVIISGVLTFGVGQIANVGTMVVGGRSDFNGTIINNAGLLDIGNTTLNFNGTEKFGSGAGGTVTGAGKIRLAPGDGSAIFGLNGLIEPAVTIASGTIEYQSGISSTNSGGIGGPFIVEAGGTLAMTYSILYLHNDVTINGTVTKAAGLPGDTAELIFNGTTFTNNGSISSIDFLTFNFSDTPRTQVIAGAGSWSMKNIDIGGTSPTSTVSLLNDVTMALNQLQVARAATLNIGNHTLTLTGSTYLFTSNGGRITGTGLVKMQPGAGTATIGSVLTGTLIDPSLEIVAGTVKLSGTVIAGRLTVDQGATLSLFGSLGLKAEGDVTINGTLNAFSGAPMMFFKGDTLTNNGKIEGNVSPIFGDYDRQYVQRLAGSGSWTGTPFLLIDSTSTTTLLSNVTYDGGSMYVEGRLNTGAFTLTLPCNVGWIGNGDVVGNVRRLNLANCPGAALAYGNPFTTIQFTSGMAPSEMMVNIALSSPAGFANAVSRAYTITPTGGNLYTATLRLHYRDSELNGNDESSLQLWRRGGGIWNAQGATNRDTNKNWVEQSGITAFSPWTLGTAVPTPMPAPATVQLSASNYDVEEECTAVLLTIERTGDLSGATTVDFATSDGGALQRTDYTIGAGTLSFAPGETSKSFSLLITEDHYVEGAEQFSITLGNPVGGLLGDPHVATVTINDDDTPQLPPATNLIDDAALFVGQTYHDFLSRQGDSDGQAYWTGEINACGSEPLCVNERRTRVSNAFYFEQEYQQTGAYVFRLYRAAYGNSQPFPNPDAANLAEARKLPSYAAFVPDRARVVGGTDVAQSQLALANLFVERPEFLTKYPGGLDGPSFISAILDTIKNDSGTDLISQQSALLTLYNSGGRGAVLYRLADDNTQTNPVNNRAFIDAEYQRAFVVTQYFGYLRRDGDIGGLLFWQNQMNTFPLRDTRMQNAMVCSFITSTEYQQRFSSVVTRTNADCPQ